MILAFDSDLYFLRKAYGIDDDLLGFQDIRTFQKAIRNLVITDLTVLNIPLRMFARFKRHSRP